MRGLMMETPLLISSLIKHAARCHGAREIVSRTVEGPIQRTTYSQACSRAKWLVNALTALGVGEGDRVATLAWNGYRHFELYYAVSGMGAVLHTINPRLLPIRSPTSSTTLRIHGIFLDPGRILGNGDQLDHACGHRLGSPRQSARGRDDPPRRRAIPTRVNWRAYQPLAPSARPHRSAPRVRQDL